MILSFHCFYSINHLSVLITLIYHITSRVTKWNILSENICTVAVMFVAGARFLSLFQGVLHTKKTRYNGGMNSESPCTWYQCDGDIYLSYSR